MKMIKLNICPVFCPAYLKEVIWPCGCIWMPVFLYLIHPRWKQGLRWDASERQGYGLLSELDCNQWRRKWTEKRRVGLWEKYARQPERRRLYLDRGTAAPLSLSRVREMESSHSFFPILLHRILDKFFQEHCSLTPRLDKVEIPSFFICHARIFRKRCLWIQQKKEMRCKIQKKNQKQLKIISDTGFAKNPHEKRIGPYRRAAVTRSILLSPLGWLSN